MNYDIEAEDCIPFSERFVWDLQAVRRLGEWLLAEVPMRVIAEEHPFFELIRQACDSLPADEELLEAIDRMHSVRYEVTSDED